MCEEVGMDHYILMSVIDVGVRDTKWRDNIRERNSDDSGWPQHLGN